MTDATLRPGTRLGRMPRPSPPRILYLGGLGRSGTTIIERLLGELPGVCPVGEVVHLWLRGVTDGERCGCGEPFPLCPFWRQVGKLAFGGWDQVDGRYVEGLRRQIDRTRRIPALALPRLTGRERRVLDEYTGYYRRIYAAVAAVSGTSCVIDSSKHPSLAFCLSWQPDLDLRVVHVVRDPRAVAYSWSKQVSRPDAAGSSSQNTRMWTYAPPTAAIQWNVQNSAVRLLARRGVPTMLVQYENFVREPGPVLRQVAAFAGLPELESVPFLGADADGLWADLPASHTVSGNPMRFSTGRIRIRRDEQWRAALPAGQRRAVTALTLPLLARYGYAQGRT